MKEILDGFNRHNGATDIAVSECEKILSLGLPTEYRNFLKEMNGGEGFIGPNAYVILWSVEELPTMNESYEVQISAPGFLAFGSDGGGECFGFDMRTAEWQIVQIPFIVMAWNAARPISTSFNMFLQRLFES